MAKKVFGQGKITIDGVELDCELVDVDISIDIQCPPLSSIQDEENEIKAYMIPKSGYDTLIDAINYDYENLMEAIDPDQTFYSPYAPHDPPKTECEHDFKTYVGLNEQFRYCTKCDKRDETL